MTTLLVGNCLSVTVPVLFLAMCSMERRKRDWDLKLMLGLNVTIDQLAMSNSVCRYVDVLSQKDGHIVRRALEFEVVGQRRA